MISFRKPVFLLGLSILSACGGPTAPAPGGDSFQPIDSDKVIFWDRQTTETALLLRAIAEDFNGQYSGLPVKIVQSGNYGDIYRKVVTGIQAGTLPGMAVAYETMIPEYANAGALTTLDDLIAHPETGLSEEELTDFFPAVLEANSFQELGGHMYSFPYTKSVLMLFYNRRVLAKAGIAEPPATWDEFLDQCRRVKKSTGNYALALDVDPSTVDGIIFSMGGEVLGSGGTLFDSKEGLQAFELFETLTREKLLYQITPRSFDDETAFGQDKVAFSFRSSASRPHFAIVMEDDSESWGMAPIPQADPKDPHTVVYGGNICIFSTTDEQRDAAWAFIKFFTSTEISVRWALGSGYLPIRKSAAEHPDMQAFWNETPYNRSSFDCLAYAHPEPNVQGWQEVRGLIAKALTSVITGLSTGRDAATELKRAADAALADR